jgi:branched-chain amino acid transport system permease protein
VPEQIATVRWWHERSELERRAISVGLIAALAIGLGFVDDTLGFAVATVGALFFLPKLDPVPRLVVEICLVAIYAYPVPALAALLAVVFGVFWLPRHIRRFALPLVLLLAAFAYPFWFQKMFTIPLFGPFPELSTGVTMLVYIMMAVGLNIVVGYAGLLDLGYVAFYATGAYMMAWFTSSQFATESAHFWTSAPKSVPGIHISVWLLLIAAGFVTAGFGVLIGLPTLRLRGDYLAIVTLGFGEILPQIARNGDQLFGQNITNGPNGITPLDSPRIGGLDFLSGHGTFFTSDRLFLWGALLLLMFTVFCSLRLRDSRLGRAWIAIREDEVAAAAMGVPLMRTKTWAYASGAFFGGIAGAYYASYKSSTFPGDFFFNISVFILCMVILGGMGNVWGVMIGAALLAYLDQEGLANIGGWLNTNVHVHIDVPLYEAGIFGVILIVVMLFRPEGLLPSARVKAELHEGVHDQPLYDVVHE